MKQVILTVMLAFMLQANAQDEIKKELEPICATFDSTYTLEGWKAKSDQLAILKGKYPENWMPAYYYAYSCIQMSYFEPALTIKDAYVDNAEEQLTVIEGCPLKDEVYIMKALVANARIGADPENRWQKYG